MKRFTLTLIGFFIFTGCGGDSDSNNTQTSPSINESLQGSWLSGCQQIDTDSSETQTLIYSDNSLTIETASYEGPNCKRQLQSIKAELDYTVSNDAFTEGADTAIDYTLNSFVFTPKEDAVVTSLNSNTACGFNDWVLFEEKNITGQDCSQTIGLNVPAEDTPLYNIFTITENILKIGDTPLVIGTLLEEERPAGEYKDTNFTLTNTSEDLDVAGTWVRPCFDTGSGTDYSREQIDIDEDTLDFFVGYYADSNCGNIFYTMLVQVDHFQQTERTPTFQGARNIEFNYQSIEITPGDATAATEMNNNSFCGMTDWQAYTSKQLIGVDCSQTFVDFPQAGETTYNTMTVIDNKLHMGRSFEGFLGWPTKNVSAYNFFAEGEIEFQRAN